MKENTCAPLLSGLIPVPESRPKKWKKSWVWNISTKQPDTAAALHTPLQNFFG
jgi:hypothetical protein